MPTLSKHFPNTFQTLCKVFGKCLESVWKVLASVLDCVIPPSKHRCQHFSNTFQTLSQALPKHFPNTFQTSSKHYGKCLGSVWKVFGMCLDNAWEVFLIAQKGGAQSVPWEALKPPPPPHLLHLGRPDPPPRR